MAWLLITVVILALPIVVVSVLPIIDPTSDFSLIFRWEEPLPSLVHRISAYAIWFAISLLVVAFWLNSKAMTQEIETRIIVGDLEKEAREHARPAMIQAKTPQDAKAQAIVYYQELGYEPKRGFESSIGQPLEVYAKSTLSNVDGFWRRDGVIIYPSGESVKFTVGILYGSDSWKFNSERLIQRQHIGRAVKIETALRRPLLRALSDKNDYLLTIGIASTRDGDNSGDRDEKLAVARAYNLGHAMLRLSWKSEDRIFGLTLGKSVEPPLSIELEPMQRVAIVVGVNATRDVLARDVVIAASKIISLEGVKLSKYSRSVSEPSQIRDIVIEGGYLDADEVTLGRQGEPRPPLLLKAVK